MRKPLHISTNEVAGTTEIKLAAAYCTACHLAGGGRIVDGKCELCRVRNEEGRSSWWSRLMGIGRKDAEVAA